MNAVTNTAPVSDAATPVLDEAATLAAYFTQVRSYQHDNARSARRSARVAWAVATGAGIIAATACIAVAGLTPLKTIVPPIVLRVDNATGMVDQVYDVLGGEMAATEAQRRYMLWKFARRWHGYSAPEAESNFRDITLMGTAAVQAQYAEDVRPTNPRSPHARLTAAGRATAEYLTLQFDGRDPKQATLRFRLREYRGDQALPVRTMQARLAFDFADGRLNDSAIHVNPIGLVVTSYRVEDEGGS